MSLSIFQQTIFLLWELSITQRKRIQLKRLSFSATVISLLAVKFLFSCKLAQVFLFTPITFFIKVISVSQHGIKLEVIID